MIRALLFDLDGTLIDTAEDIAASTNHALAVLGLPARSVAEVSRMVGRGVENLLRAALDDATVDLSVPLEAFRAHYDAHCLDRTRPFPGVPEILREFSRGERPMGVISNKPVEFSEKILAGLDLRRHFDLVLGPPVVAVKPDPEGVLRVAAAWGVSPAEILLVGDSEVDRETAARAGCAFRHVPGGLAPGLLSSSLATG